MKSPSMFYSALGLGWFTGTRIKTELPEYCERVRVQELCESRGGRPGLSVLTNFMVSVDVKQH